MRDITSINYELFIEQIITITIYNEIHLTNIPEMFVDSGLPGVGTC